MPETKMNNQFVRRVLIVGCNSLFDEGLRAILSNKQHLKVASLAYSDDAAFKQRFLSERPDTIILFEICPLNVNRVFELICGDSGTDRLRVIVVGANRGKIEIYHKYHFTTVGSSQLLALLRKKEKVP